MWNFSWFPSTFFWPLCLVSFGVSQTMDWRVWPQFSTLYLVAHNDVYFSENNACFLCNSSPFLIDIPSRDFSHTINSHIVSPFIGFESIRLKCPLGGFFLRYIALWKSSDCLLQHNRNCTDMCSTISNSNLSNRCKAIAFTTGQPRKQKLI